MATLELELFACERYRPIAGWSADYLLPTDRYPLRARGSKKCWPSLAEAEAALLAPGWAWEELRDDGGGALAWEVDPRGQQADTEGWSYGAGFSSSYEGSAKPGLQRFVRWRRLVRTQNFAGGPESLLGSGGVGATAVPLCPNVDLDGAERIGRMLLEALAMASLHGEWSAPALVQLKSLLLERLVGKASGERETFEAMISSYVNSHRGMATRVAGAFKNSDPDEAILNTRICEVKESFPLVEREAFAVLAIWRFRPDLACRSAEAEHECALRPVLCPHAGCKERCSAKALEAHDRACPRKLLACEKCREEVPRSELRVHAVAACPMRETSCTFSALGCEVPLNRCDLERHLEECTQAHLMLLMRTMLEQQDIIRTLTSRLGDLEARGLQESATREAEVKAQVALAGQVASLEAKLAALEKKAASDLKKASEAASEEARKKAEAAGQEARKKLDAAVATQRSELGALRTEVASVRTSVAELAPLRGEVASLRAAAVHSREGAGAAAASR